MIWRSMILSLFFIFFAEILGLYIGRKYHNNQWLYNIILIFVMGFTNLMFYNLFSQYIKGKWVVVVNVILTIVLYINDFVTHGFFFYNNVTYSAMSVQFVLCSVFYFYLLIKDDNYIDLRYSAEFWWIAGTLLFYFGSTASNLFDDKLYSIVNGQINDLTNFIFKVLNIILYGCWSYSFICRKWQTTTRS